MRVNLIFQNILKRKKYLEDVEVDNLFNVKYWILTIHRATHKDISYKKEAC